jgi:hypothetical protein
MLGFGLALLLAIGAIVAFPCWRHSAGWGYGPTTVAGGLLVLLATVTIAFPSSSQQTAPTRIVAQRV